jgi:hypothetical protein
MTDILETTEPAAPTPSEPASTEEQILTTEIANLWSAHNEAKANAKRTKTELAHLRSNLASHLHLMKGLLVHTGRSGGWAGFLRSQRIPLASGDRYVRRHEMVLHPEAKLLTEEASQDDAINNLVKSVLPKVKRALKTGAAFQSFVRLLAAELDFVSDTDVADGLPIQAQ